MNLNYKLFQFTDYTTNFFKSSLNEFMGEMTETCKNSDNEENCFEKQRLAHEFTFNVLKEQLEREEKLDWKYEKMAKFKTLRRDADRTYTPFKY